MYIYIHRHRKPSPLSKFPLPLLLHFHTNRSPDQEVHRPLQTQKRYMSGIWVFEPNGVFRQGEMPGGGTRRKALVHLPTGEVVSSYTFLEQILRGLGWERYHMGNHERLEFHKHTSIDLISLPRDFTQFNSVCMYDIVVKNPNVFKVRDI